VSVRPSVKYPLNYPTMTFIFYSMCTGRDQSSSGIDSQSRRSNAQMCVRLLVTDSNLQSLAAILILFVLQLASVTPIQFLLIDDVHFLSKIAIFGMESCTVMGTAGLRDGDGLRGNTVGTGISLTVTP